MAQISPQPNLAHADLEHAYSRTFWFAIVLIGVGTGLLGGLLMRFLFAVEWWAWSASGGNLVEAASQTSPIHRVGMLLLAGVIVGVGTRLLNRAVGRGADVNVAIWTRWGEIPVLATLARAAQSLTLVGLGTSLGREASIKQAGAAVACAVARWAGVPREQQRLMVAWGVGAGMAAAYNVPLGGALFAVEVLLGAISLELILPALVMSAAATTASWLLLPAGPLYRVQELTLSPALLAWSLVAGPVCGLVALCHIRAVGVADRQKPQGWMAIVLPIAVLGALGVVTIAFPQLLGNGMDSVQSAFDDQVSFGLLATLPPLKMLAIFVCLACGARGGLFTPTMMVGALVGGLLAHGLQFALPGAAPQSCAVIGACAVLAAASQGPLSAVVLVLELTRNIDATMVPMLVAVCGAMLVVRRFEKRSIYSIRVPQTPSA